MFILTDVFQNFSEMCLNIYSFDPDRFLTPLGVSSIISSFKKEQSKIRFFN